MTKSKDLILGGSMLLLGSWYIWQTLQLPKGEHLLNSSQSFPLLIGATLVLLALILLIKGLVVKKDEETKKVTVNKQAIKRGIVYIVFTAIYIFLLIPFLGFLIATAVYLVPMVLFYKEVKWYTSLIIAAGTIIFVYYVFNQLLLIKFPG